MKERRFPFLLLIAYFLLTVSGCTFWHNFSTYFNTIYLAKEHLEAYEEQQKAIVPQNTNGAIAVLKHRWIDEEYEMRLRGLKNGNPQPITPSFSQSVAASKQVNNVHLDSAIILGSKVLADKKGSKYIEDALYVVGKASFYKNDFAGAQRKFLELLSRNPGSEYGPEIRTLLARAMVTTRSFDSAATTLSQGLKYQQEQGNKAGVSSIHRALAEYIYAKNPDSLTALSAELRAAEDGLSGEELARLAYEEGIVDYVNGDWPSAERAFEVTYNSAKDDWLAGEAHDAHALALRREGKYDESRAELESVISKVKYSSTHAAARYDLAFNDEVAARYDVAGDLRGKEFKEKYHPKLHQEYYALDTAYHNTSGQIVSRAHFRQAEMYREMGYYDSAAKQATTLVGTKDFSSQAMNEFVAQRATSLASFAKWKQELGHLDSVEIAMTPNGARKAQQDETVIHTKALQEVLGGRWRPEMPVPLTHEDSVRLPGIEARLMRERKPLPKINFTDSTRFVDSIHRLEAEAHYQLGRAYETFGEVPEARTEYKATVDVPGDRNDTARTALDAQTIYAWMQLEHFEKNQKLADSLLHDLLTNYGQTIYAQQARMLFAATEYDSPGETAYRQVYDILRQTGLDAAKQRLLEIAAKYSQQDVAPRALYAVGVTYEEMSRYDSAVRYYKQVMKDYPYSSYALALRPRLADATTPGLPHANPPHLDPTIATPPTGGGMLTPNQNPQRPPRGMVPPGLQQHQPNFPPGMQQHRPPPHLPPNIPGKPALNPADTNK